jgi:hypothetical protein
MLELIIRIGAVALTVIIAIVLVSPSDKNTIDVALPFLGLCPIFYSVDTFPKTQHFDQGRIYGRDKREMARKGTVER